MKKLMALAATTAILFYGHPVSAAVSQAEAQQLGTTLTGVGAEKAGNADGSIPAYTGGFITPPSNVSPSNGHYPDPFASEKPLLSINASNVAQYANNLTPGTIAMIRKYPAFRVDVYPTHRTAPFPQWVLDNTKKNATSAQLIGGPSVGDGVKGAYGGIPFPIPKSGAEVIWNYYLRWTPVSVIERGPNMLVDASGHQTLLGNFTNIFASLYNDQSKTALSDVYFYKQLDLGNAPSSQVGYNIIISYPIDYTNNDQLTWVYTLGQRRVRIAPEFAYDTPAANFGGALNYDEIYMYAGRLDRFDFKLIGKKEIYIPYNDYKAEAAETKTSVLLTPSFPNPDYVRWEKHRVWVVEATLKPNKRHVLARRTFFVDEDSWLIVATDGYDHGRNLYRVGFDMPIVVYDKTVPHTSPTFYYLTDLTKGSYFSNTLSPEGYVKVSGETPNLGQFTPSRLAATGIR